MYRESQRGREPARETERAPERSYKIPKWCDPVTQIAKRHCETGQSSITKCNSKWMTFKFPFIWTAVLIHTLTLLQQVWKKLPFLIIIIFYYSSHKSWKSFEKNLWKQIVRPGSSNKEIQSFFLNSASFKDFPQILNDILMQNKALVFYEIAQQGSHVD